ncbi:MAG: alginate lyase family protein [Marinovum sp.]|nr:alginate lyase family protein [Marinovum sp.]
MRLLCLVLFLSASSALAACPVVPKPIVSLDFVSRYDANDPTRSTIDNEADKAARLALAALEEFVRDLSQQTDQSITAQDAQAAACVVNALATWARADALSALGSETVQLTIGSRLAALALVAAQVIPVANTRDAKVIRAWLTRRMNEQMTYWETAPKGSASGNLRAWAALAGAATSLITGDTVTRGWAAWSLSYVACTAQPDGSLPQEMRRAHLALHYQIHALGPMVVAAALLERQGVSVLNQCGRALDRIVDYTLTDVQNGGVASAKHAGAAQSLRGGLAGLKDFQVAWGEAWLTLRFNPRLKAELKKRRPLRYSKLGGNQTRIWNQR